MTRQDMVDYITDELSMFEGSGYADSPNALGRQITTACDELARLAKGVYLRFYDDLVAGQAVYCASPLLKIIGATAFDTAGNAYPLGFMTARDLIETTLARTSVPALGPPRYYVSEGANKVELYPAPSYTTAGNPATKTGYGLMVEGPGVPGDTWPLPTDACPLPENQHMGVVYGTLVKRCRQFPKFLGDRLPGYLAEWTWYKGHIESQVALQTSADRRRMREYGGDPIWATNGPLDS